MTEEFKDINVDDIEFIQDSTTTQTVEETPAKKEGNPTDTSKHSATEPEKKTSTETMADDKIDSVDATTATTNATTTPATEKEKGTETTQKPTDQQESTVDFDALLQKKSGGQFGSYKQLTDQVEQLTKNQRTAQDKLDNDLIQKFRDFRQGRNIENKEAARLFLETQLMDVSSLDPLEAIKAKMKMDNPKRSDADIDFLLNNRYKLDENEYDPNEIRLARLQMEDDAFAAKKELQTIQEKAALKDLDKNAGNSSATTTTATTKEQQEYMDKANQKWEQDVEVSMTEFQQMKLQLGKDKEPFSFTLDNQTEIKNTLSNLPLFWNRYVTEDKDGNITEHIDQLRNDLSLITNQQTILNSVFEQGISKGKQLMLDERKTPSTLDTEQQKDEQQAQSGTAKSELEELAEGFAIQLNNN